MSEYKMWIGGKWADAESGKTYPVFNPVTEAEIARVPLGDKADVDKAVEAARKAFVNTVTSEAMEKIAKINVKATAFRSVFMNYSLRCYGT